MGEVRSGQVNGQPRLMVPDCRLVGVNGQPLTSPGLASAAVERKEYGVVVLEDGVMVRRVALHDPFVRVERVIRGWRKAWRVLWRGVRVEVQIHGTAEGVRRVMGPGAEIRP